MSLFDFIKSLAVTFSPSLNVTRHNSDDSNVTKIEAKNSTGDVAGRDIIKNYNTPSSTLEESPYVYCDGSFGGNGVRLRFAACKTHNLSNHFIFLDHINILGRIIRFKGQIIKAGDTISHTGIDDLNYPDTNTDRFLEIYFKTKNGKQFVARQKLQYGSRQDGKFNIVGLENPQVESTDL